MVSHLDTLKTANKKHSYVRSHFSDNFPMKPKRGTRNCKLQNSIFAGEKWNEMNKNEMNVKECYEVLEIWSRKPKPVSDADIVWDCAVCSPLFQTHQTINIQLKAWEESSDSTCAKRVEHPSRILTVRLWKSFIFPGPKRFSKSKPVKTSYKRL
jgi:hypothetical protein